MSFRRILAALVLFLGCLAVVPVEAAGTKTHVVEPGHSLWGIARRYGVSVEAIRARNGLESDKIVPGQKLEIPPKSWKPKRSARVHDGDTKRKRGGNWVLSKPAPSTQVQKTARERGINPCNTPDPGYGVYDHWSRAPSMGQMIAPQRGGITASGQFDVMFHFHGHEAVRKEWVQVMQGPVLVGVDLGIGSGPYSAAFRSPAAFEKLVQSVERAMAKKTGKKRARVRKVGLSAWSAGYGAVEQILSQPYGRRKVDTVILLDGLHSGYAGNSLDENQLEPFIRFARLAKSGRKLMFVSHSSIIPPGYASTTETAHFLISKLGGKPSKTRPRSGDPMGLDLISRFTSGNFHVRGYAGNDTMDHCAHIGLYRDVLKVHVKRRWNSPRGYKKK